MARIVFDLDGTLVDSAPDIRAVANAVLTDEGRAPLSLAETHAFIGEGTKVFVERMRIARDIPATAQERLHDAFLPRYQGAVALTEMYDGVTDALRALKEAGHVLGLCTNKPEGPADAVLRHFGLTDLFATRIGGDSLAQRKPDPAPLNAAFDAMGDGPRLYVGDSETDAETADRAGVPFLLFTRGYRKSPVEALPHLASFDDWADLPAMVSDAL